MGIYNNTIQTSINWASTVIDMVVPTLGTSNEPAITAANMTIQRIVAPPFSWAWNRSFTNFQVVPFTHDYAVTINDFAWLEAATFQPSAAITNVVGSGTTATITAVNSFVAGNRVTISGLTHTAFNVTNAVIIATTPTTFTFASATSQTSIADTGLALSGAILPLTIKNNTALGESSESAQPLNLGVYINNGAGSITFRLLPTADQNYNVVVTYQKFFPQVAALATTWNIPDYMELVYNAGFLAHLYEFAGDSREAAQKVKFAAALLSYADGLTQTQINVFLAQYLANPMMLQNLTLSGNQGAQSRGQ